MRTKVKTPPIRPSTADADVIERQLAHVERNKVRGAYNRAEYLPERRKMVQAWADMVDAYARGAEVVPINRRARG